MPACLNREACVQYVHLIVCLRWIVSSANVYFHYLNVSMRAQDTEYPIPYLNHKPAPLTGRDIVIGTTQILTKYCVTLTAPNKESQSSVNQAEQSESAQPSQFAPLFSSTSGFVLRVHHSK